jgi:hypothetical protein
MLVKKFIEALKKSHNLEATVAQLMVEYSKLRNSLEKVLM